MAINGRNPRRVRGRGCSCSSCSGWIGDKHKGNASNRPWIRDRAKLDEINTQAREAQYQGQ